MPRPRREIAPADAPRSVRWLVGYLFNNNGMGTWCWEAAHALAAAGEDVTLVASFDVVLPGPTSLSILRVAAAPIPSGGIGKLLAPGAILAAQGPRVMRAAVEQLAAAGTPVSVILLNSTEFVDTSIAIPQMATAWARGILLRDYVARLRVHLRGPFRVGVRTVIGTLGWWRRDWHGYRAATIVLAVTSPLAKELAEHGVRAEMLHPCTHTPALDARPRSIDSPVRLLTAAAVLDEPRKRVLWMLAALREWRSGNCTLTLVGTASASVREAARELGMAITFTGPLSRDDVVRTMREHDVFLFASELDDWGYVVTEAMAQGLAVVAPDLVPFNEILGDTGALYRADSPEAFRAALSGVVEDAASEGERCWARAQREFSRAAFVARLKEIAGEIRA